MSEPTFVIPYMEADQPQTTTCSNVTQGSIDLDLDVLAADAKVVGGDIGLRGIEGHSSGLDVEAGAVPGAFDFFTVEVTVTQRPSLVGAFIVNGVELTVHVEQSDPAAFDLDAPPRLIGDVRHPRDTNKLGHGRVLDGHLQAKASARRTAASMRGTSGM